MDKIYYGNDRIDYIVNDFGYTEGMTSMKGGRIKKTLLKDGRISLDVYLMSECGYNKLECEEGYRYYSTRIEDYTKPKTEYRLRNEGRSYYKITKTEYEFCKWFMENKLHIDYAYREVHEAIRAEEERAKEEAIRKEQEEREKEERAWEYRCKKDKALRTWLTKKIMELDENDEDVKKVLKVVRANTDDEYIYHYFYLIITVRNKDKKACQENMNGILSNVGGNPISRKCFKAITGISLPRTVKGTLDTLSKFYEK